MNRLPLLAAMASVLFSSAAFAGAEASSFKKNNGVEGERLYSGNAAIDGDPATAWMVPGSSDNAGEYIILDMPKAKINSLGMYVGYVASEQSFQDYARIKTVTVEVFQYNEIQDLVPVEGMATVTFEDKADYQVQPIEGLEIASETGGRLKITIKEVYPGRDFSNFAISELLVGLDDFDVATTIEDVSSEPSGSHSRIELTDDNPRSYWYGDIDATVQFTANGYMLSKVGLQPGPRAYARPKKIQITANGRVHQQELPDDGKMQWIEIPPVSGYSGSAWGTIEMKILEVYPGPKPEVAIGELDLKATAYMGF
ncbi:MAG: hypothetical protein AAFV53_01270 [Myxococcota bacterium]